MIRRLVLAPIAVTAGLVAVLAAWVGVESWLRQREWRRYEDELHVPAEGSRR